MSTKSTCNHFKFLSNPQIHLSLKQNSSRQQREMTFRTEMNTTSSLYISTSHLYKLDMSTRASMRHTWAQRRHLPDDKRDHFSPVTAAVNDFGFWWFRHLRPPRLVCAVAAAELPGSSGCCSPEGVPLLEIVVASKILAASSARFLLRWLRFKWLW